MWGPRYKRNVCRPVPNPTDDKIPKNTKTRLDEVLEQKNKNKIIARTSNFQFVRDHGMYKSAVLLLFCLCLAEAQNCDPTPWDDVYKRLGLDEVEDTFMYVAQSGSIQQICKGNIKTFPSLQLIVVNGGNINYIETGAFESVGEISIDLEGNKLTEVNTGIFTGTQITSVNLKRNQIRTIHSNAFDNMPNLQTVLLANNKITRWNNEWFKNTPKLSTIIFSSNLIESLPEDAFKNVKSNRNLTVLLDGNKIKNIHLKSFHGLENAAKINLASNELDDTLPQQLFDGFNARVLDLQENKFRCFSEGRIRSLRNVSVVKLQRNPLSTECRQQIEKGAEIVGIRVVLSDDPFSF